MNLPKRINPDYLVDTIVEIKINSKYPQELWAGIIYKKISERGYEYTKTSKVNINIPFRGDVMSISIDNNIYSGAFTKDDIRFVIQKDAISFNCSFSHYVGWAMYIQEIKNVIKLLQDCEIVQKFNAIYLRYINEFKDIDIISKINEKYLSMSVGTAFKSQEVKLHLYNNNMDVNVSLANNVNRRSPINNNSRYVASLFDINVKMDLTNISSIENLIDFLNNIHRTEKETFFGLLQQDFIQTLNPEY